MGGGSGASLAGVRSLIPREEAFLPGDGRPAAKAASLIRDPCLCRWFFALWSQPLRGVSCFRSPCDSGPITLPRRRRLQHQAHDSRTFATTLQQHLPHRPATRRRAGRSRTSVRPDISDNIQLRQLALSSPLLALLRAAREADARGVTTDAACTLARAPLSEDDPKVMERIAKTFQKVAGDILHTRGPRYAQLEIHVRNKLENGRSPF